MSHLLMDGSLQCERNCSSAQSGDVLATMVRMPLSDRFSRPPHNIRLRSRVTSRTGRAGPPYAFYLARSTRGSPTLRGVRSEGSVSGFSGENECSCPTLSRAFLREGGNSRPRKSEEPSKPTFHSNLVIPPRAERMRRNLLFNLLYGTLMVEIEWRRLKNFISEHHAAPVFVIIPQVGERVLHDLNPVHPLVVQILTDKAHLRKPQLQIGEIADSQQIDLTHSTP